MGPHQDALLDAPAASRRRVASALDRPVARVLLDSPLARLDRLFDYLVPEEMDGAAHEGTRVRVRFGDQEVHGWVWERTQTTTHPGRLAPLRRVVSDLPVLPPRSRTLVEAVAERTAGTRADVVRLAVPSRHAREERAERQRPAPTWPVYAAEPVPACWQDYEGGPDLLAALSAGRAPRAVLAAVPGRRSGTTWAELLAHAARATLSSGRGVLAVVATTADAERLATYLRQALPGEPVAVLSAEHGPGHRYRHFTAVLTGHVRAVVGTRSAVFAPVDRLGLVALWDDGDDRLDEPRAPYVHARTVAALRSSLEGAGLLLAGYSTSVEAASYVAHGWARLVRAPRETARARVARVEVPGAPELEREGDSGRARIPSLAFRAVREALGRGPVLVQVPRRGYAPVVVCQQCRAAAVCPRCSGPVTLGRDGVITCRWCSRQAAGWVCPQCGGRRLRMVSVGSVRTGEELGRAFPGVPVVVSGGGHGVVTDVDASARLVVATPGAEPVAEGGYRAVLILDGAVLSARPELGASTEALRRWSGAVALAAPDARAIVLGSPDQAVAQALVRWDQAGFARRELGERAELHLPPAWRCARLDGASRAVQALAEQARERGWEVLVAPSSPQGDGTDRARALIRVPLAQGRQLARWLRVRQRERSARREEPVRVELDPTVLW